MRVSSGEMVGQILQSNWFPQSCPVFENFAPALAGHYLIWYLRIIVYIYICMYLFFYSSFYVFICLFIQYIKDDLGYLGVNVHVDVEKSFGISCLKWARRSPTSQCETKLFWLMRGDYTTQYVGIQTTQQRNPNEPTRIRGNDISGWCFHYSSASAAFAGGSSNLAIQRSQGHRLDRFQLHLPR